MKIVSVYAPLGHYRWGDENGGEAWSLLEEKPLSVKLEKMAAHTTEQRHYHRWAQQFFFILKGSATLEMEAERAQLQPGEGIHIPPGMKHRIANESSDDLEFLLASQPSTGQDRVNC